MFRQIVPDQYRRMIRHKIVLRLHNGVAKVRVQDADRNILVGVEEVKKDTAGICLRGN